MRVAHFYFTAHVRYNTMSITAQRATQGNIAMALASAGKSLTEIAPALKRVETRLNGDVAKAVMGSYGAADAAAQQELALPSCRQKRSRGSLRRS